MPLHTKFRQSSTWEKCQLEVELYPFFQKTTQVTEKCKLWPVTPLLAVHRRSWECFVVPHYQWVHLLGAPTFKSAEAALPYCKNAAQGTHGLVGWWLSGKVFLGFRALTVPMLLLHGTASWRLVFILPYFNTQNMIWVWYGSICVPPVQR